MFDRYNLQYGEDHRPFIKQVELPSERRVFMNTQTMSATFFTSIYLPLPRLGRLLLYTTRHRLYGMAVTIIRTGGRVGAVSEKEWLVARDEKEKELTKPRPST